MKREMGGDVEGPKSVGNRTGTRKQGENVKGN